MIINDDKNVQLALNFAAGLPERYGSLREVVAAGVYRRGLSRCAIDLDQAPSNLSVQLSGDMSRHLSVDTLEKYIEKTGDVTPIHYLAERFLAGKGSERDDAIRQAERRLNEAQALIASLK